MAAKRKPPPSGLRDYLGQRVYIEAFGHKKHGIVCSVYHSRDGEAMVEVEFDSGEMRQTPFPKIVLLEADR